MSAVNVVQRREAVYLFSDGASYDIDGRLSGIAGKSHLLSSISTVMVGSGRAIIMPFIAHHIERAANDYDHLKSIVADRLPGIEEHLTELFGEDPKRQEAAGQSFQLYFAGYSEEASKPDAFMISTRERAGRPAYSLISGSWQVPGVPPEFAKLGYGGPFDLATCNIENLALTTLELQRRVRPSDWEGCRVGGFAELVTVTRDHINIRILKRWAEDMVGEFMMPAEMDWMAWRRAHPIMRVSEGSEPSGDPTAGMSKLQRDIYLRKQAKAKRRAA